MRQLFLDKGAISVKQVSEPLLDDNCVLVQVHYSFISSGTELATIGNAQKSVFFSGVPQKIQKVLASISEHGFAATKALVSEKLKGSVQQIGYSCSGKIIAVGKKVRNRAVGDLVACAGAGYANHADIVCVPEQLTATIKNKSCVKQASVTTIAAIALQGIRRAQLELGQTVAVVGLGLLGQLTVQLAKRSGCRVIGIDVLPERLQLAKQLGADYTFTANENTVQEATAITDRYGVDAAIITAASKSSAIMQQAFEITRKKGKVVIVGDVGLNLERAPWYAKEIDVLMSCSYGPGRYDTQYEQKGVDYPYAYVRWTEQRNMQACVELIENKQLEIDSLISGQYQLQDVAAAYNSLQQQNNLGAVLYYGSFDTTNFAEATLATQDERREDSTSSKGIDFLTENLEENKILEKNVTPSAHPECRAERGVSKDKAKKDTLNIGIIGAGGFAKTKLLPIIKSIKNTNIAAIVDPNPAAAENTARVYNAAKVLSKDDELFTNIDTTDVVVIASPHTFHAVQTINSLEHGKAVFVEKPLVTTFEQLETITPVLQQNTALPLTVDFNRSFAPFIQNIKQVVEKRTSPLMIQYRMNAGYIPKEHWVQTEVGGGRIIGEACHIIDLFYYLTDSSVISVSVESMQAQQEHVFANDNVNVQLRFADGSVCSLLYTALGNKALGKERMELFFDGKVVVMDDYKTLQGFGISGLDATVKQADKGHSNLLNAFFTALSEPTFVPPIPLQRLLDVSRTTLIIDKLANAGGGEHTA